MPPWSAWSSARRAGQRLGGLLEERDRVGVRAGEQPQRGAAGARRAQPLAERGLLAGQPPGLGRVPQDDQCLRRLGAPAREDRMADAELSGAGGSQAGVGQRLLGPVLGEPEPGPGRQQQQRGERAVRRHGLLARLHQHCVGAGQVVSLDERVDQEGQAPQHRRRR
jgi:hypothetical protein